MKRYNIITITTYGIAMLVWAVLLAFGITACTREPDVYTGPGTGNSGRISVELRVPCFELPSTRSIEDAKGEAAVKSIDLLIFDKTSPKPQLLNTFNPGTGFTQSTDGAYYIVSFDADISLFSGAGTVAAVANARQSVETALSGGDQDKPSIMEKLLYYPGPGDGGTYKWDVDDTYTPIPMYGEMTITGTVTQGSVLSDISLVRMTARVDVQNLVDGSVFQLQEISVVNYPDGGRIDPAWDDATGAVYRSGESGYIYERNAEPDIPATTTLPDMPMTYTYPQAADASGDMFSGEIYVFETPSGDGKAPEERVGLILRGLYQGTETFYRVDFTCGADVSQGGTVYAKKGDLMPLYRNHKYTVTITAAEDIGYGTFDEALRSETILSNLRTTILSVDANGMNDIVFDGQYFLAMKTSMIELSGSLSDLIPHEVSSNYTGPWTASVVDPASNPWLTLWDDANSNGTVDAGELKETIGGSDINTAPLQINLTPAVPSPATAKIKITAGRLTHTLTINRTAVPTSITDRMARSNVVMNAAGELVFAVSEADNAAIPANSQGVMFKWGSLVAVSPAGIPYAPGTHVVYNPTGQSPASWGDQLAGWDKIPYAHPDFGFDFTSTADDVDAFEQYGFNESEGVGDVCRYIASKGWVAGNWRMPTYTELLELVSVSTGGGVGSGTFTDQSAALNANPSPYYKGFYYPASGYFLGNGINTSSASAPVGATRYLPASGHRYPDGNGDVVQVGMNGYYWSATPYTTYTVNYLYLGIYGTDFYDADRSYAFPVRCIWDNE